MIPLRDDNPSQSVPVVTRTLIAVNVVAFVFELSLGGALGAFVQWWGLVPLRFSYAFAGAEPLAPTLATAFTSMFLHGGWIHLLGNLWYLWIFGDNVEDSLGHWKFLLFYLAGGFTAAAVHLVFNLGSPVPTVGASGAIAAVLGAYGVLFPRARVVTLVPIFVFFQIVALPALLVLGLWFVIQIFTGTLSIGASGGGVAWWAHIGGFVFGMAVVLIGRRVGGGRRGERSEAWVQE
ncbi:MAG: rhomboid family intramembrane serine protease [Candidatus Eisenbacteria bacterium]|nr:rhomboid family intramembrane serine protease [Candidatus Eisenbacteria bacterium]